MHFDSGFDNFGSLFFYTQMSYRSGHPHRRGASRSGQRAHDPSIGSRLPQQIREELEERGKVTKILTGSVLTAGFPLEQDDRRFQKKFVNRAANRKELRKQKRQEKGKRKAIQHVEQLTKRQKTSNHTLINKNKSSSNNNDTSSPADSKKKNKNEKFKPVDNDEALKRLSKSNPQLYSLLKEEDLVNGESTSDTRFEDDDRDIAYWEKKLGMDKKKTKGYGKAFEEDGLLDLLDGLDTNADDQNESNESYLQRKRQKATSESDAKKVI